MDFIWKLHLHFIIVVYFKLIIGLFAVCDYVTGENSLKLNVTGENSLKLNVTFPNVHFGTSQWH